MKVIPLSEVMDFFESLGGEGQALRDMYDAVKLAQSECIRSGGEAKVSLTIEIKGAGRSVEDGIFHHTPKVSKKLPDKASSTTTYYVVEGVVTDKDPSQFTMDFKRE